MTQIPQQKPDYSGEWTLNLQASALSAKVAAATQSGVLRIEHHEPTFKAHQTIVMDGNPLESKFEVLTDGREVVTVGFASILRWDGDALVFTFRISSPFGPGSNANVIISFRYELQDGGRRLRAAEQLRGGGRDQDNLWVFDRQ